MEDFLKYKTFERHDDSTITDFLELQKMLQMKDKLRY